MSPLEFTHNLRTCPVLGCCGRSGVFRCVGVLPLSSILGLWRLFPFGAAGSPSLFANRSLIPASLAYHD